MNDNYNFIRSFQQMQRILQLQQQKIQRLEKVLREHESLISELRNRPVTHIDKIEYKFDQLKVESLEGTLNIGLSPNGDGPIDEFEVNQNGSVISNHHQPNPGIFEMLHTNIHHYLTEDCPSIIQSLEQKRSIRLDPSFRKFMIEDVRRQIDERIHHYVNQMNLEEFSPEQLDEKTKEIAEKVKEDINRAFDSFLNQMPEGGGGQQ